MEYVLLTSFIVLTIVSFTLLKYDPFSPGFLMSASFTFSILCLCYNAKIWDIDIDPLTLKLLFFGVFTFIVGNTLCQCFYSKRLKRAAIRNRQNIGVQEFKNNEVVTISRNFVGLIFCFNCIVMILYFIEVIHIAGFGSFSIMMYKFRQATGFEGASVSVVVNILVRISKAFSTIFIYYCINNVIANKSFKSQRYLLLPIIPDFLCGLLTGGRFRMLQLILGPIIIYVFLSFIKTGKRIKLKPSLICKAIFIAAMALFLFYSVKGLVGRVVEKDIITYVTEYFGGPIELFDVILRGAIPYRKPEVLGRNTFASVYRYFVKFFSFDIGPAANPGFLTSRTGINLGNVFTCFFNYYADFGILGIIVLTFISGTIWSTFYYKCMTSYKNVYKIIYSFVFYGILFQFYDEMTFTIFLSADMCMSFIFIIIFEKHIKTKVRF